MQWIIKRISIKIVLTTILGSALLAVSGCDPQFAQDGQRAQPGAMSACDKWTVTGSGNAFRNLRFAHDNNLMTACTTKSYYRNAVITVDLGRPCLFNTIAIPHGPDEYGFVKRLDVLISNDGKKYQKIYEGVGTRKVTYINILSPVSARYIKLVATRPGRRSWSVAEIYFQ